MLAAFLSGPENRLADLLAFGMAAEGGKPLPPAEIAALRAKAQAELQAHAILTLHNQVETIRLEAAQQALGRVTRPLGFHGVIAANMVALAAAGALSFALWVLYQLATGG